VKEAWLRVSVGAVAVLGLFVGSGCAGSGKVLSLNVRPQFPVEQFDKPESVKIVIEPFEDERTEKSRIGLRTHLGGGVTYFNVMGGKPGDTVAQALADVLKHKGWHGRAWNVTLAPSGGGPTVSDADIIITGEVLEFAANAKSRFFSTKISTETKLVFRAHNLADQSTTIRHVEGSQTHSVFWFEPEDVQKLMASTLRDGIDRFIADTRIEDRSLRSVPK